MTDRENVSPPAENVVLPSPRSRTSGLPMSASQVTVKNLIVPLSEYG
jgi:hypothetical protein